MIYLSTQTRLHAYKGPGNGIVSGKTRKAILDRILKQYPKISIGSANMIVNEAIRENTVRSNINKSKKTISGLQANSRHIYAASLANQEIPAYAYIDLVRDGKVEPSDTTTTNNLRSASQQGAKNYLTIQMHQDGKKIESSNMIKSAAVKDNSWLFTDRKLVNRNAFEYQKQEAEKTSNIRSASTTTDDRPAWLVILDHLKGQ